MSGSDYGIFILGLIAVAIVVAVLVWLYRRPPQQPMTALARAPNLVAIGVIDQGIAFAHQRFRNAAGTRVAAIWVQDQDTILDQATITLAIANAKTRGEPDDVIYRALGALDYSQPGYKPLAMRRAHGTHVLDLAAGAAESEDIRDRPIIAVDMPESAVGDPVGSTLKAHALLGIFFILEEAAKICPANQTLPVVINLSYGPYDGPHDGSTDFERAVDLIQQLWEGTSTPVRFVFAAGNSRLLRVHASETIPAGQKKDWSWRVQPEDKTPSFLELWFDSPDVAVELVPPVGSKLQVSQVNLVDTQSSMSGIRYRMTFTAGVAASPKTRVVIFLAPTATDPPLASNQPTAPAGLWRIEVRNTGAAPVVAEGWTRRDETLTGRRAHGRQAYFDDPSYQRFSDTTRPIEFGGNGYINTRETLSGIATGQSTFVIGGYCRGFESSEMRPAPYSSGGPHLTIAGTPKLPTCLFPSEDSIACRGVLAAGVQSGSTVAMNGTSVAAPQATRWIADQRATTGVFPTPAFVNLVQPRIDPLRPISAADISAFCGDGLMPMSSRTGRP